MLVLKFLDELKAAYEKRDDRQFAHALEALKGAMLPPLQVTIGCREKANRGDVVAQWICGMFPDQTKA